MESTLVVMQVQHHQPSFEQQYAKDLDPGKNDINLKTL